MQSTFYASLSRATDSLYHSYSSSSKTKERKKKIFWTFQVWVQKIFKINLEIISTKVL